MDNLVGLVTNKFMAFLTDEQFSQIRGQAKKVGRTGTFGQGIQNALGRAGERATTAFQQTKGGQINPLSGSVQTVGAGAGLIGDVIFQGLKAVTPEPVEQAVKSGIESVASQPGVQDVLGKVNQWASQHPEAAANLQSLLDISALAPVGKAGQLASRGVGQGVGAVGDINRTIKEGVPSVIKGATEITKAPPLKPLEAVGQVLQGKSRDVNAGVKAFSSLNLEGVETFKDLGSKMSTKIKELAKQVDDDLGLDETRRATAALTLNTKNAAGKIIKDNPVGNALNQLEELYTKIGDKVKLSNIQDLRKLAKGKGLTNLEINNLAREYGVEFSTKAFNKMGDALTSVNAQLYENTRKALKSLARSGIKGEAAKLADETMSALINTQKLIKNNVEAVNKLKQKIQSRGLLEKVGNQLAKYADVLTGGSLRGFVGGMLPRGAGYKTLNALDIEEMLQKNLKIIQEAIKSKSDDEIKKILEKLK